MDTQHCLFDEQGPNVQCFEYVKTSVVKGNSKNILTNSFNQKNYYINKVLVNFVKE